MWEEEGRPKGAISAIGSERRISARRRSKRPKGHSLRRDIHRRN
ncbi:hypothetical protein [Rhizobium sp. CNPSo 3968]